MLVKRIWGSQSSRPGDLLIEAMLSSLVFIAGFLVIYTGYANSRLITVRNLHATAAFNLIADQLELDATVDYATFNSASPLLPYGGLPDGYFRREVVEDPVLKIKRVKYLMTWVGPGESNQAVADFVLTANGVSNVN